MLLILEELNSPGIGIPSPHLRHTTNPGGAEYDNGDNSTEHHHRLNGVCPDDRLQATLKCKIKYILSLRIILNIVTLCSIFYACDYKLSTFLFCVQNNHLYFYQQLQTLSSLLL